MAQGNTFGATALSSYGGFWISLGIALTPGGFDIAGQYTGNQFYQAFGFYLIVRPLSLIPQSPLASTPSNMLQGWFIFTFLLWILTLRSTVVFSLLFLWVWVTFLCLAISYFDAPNTIGCVPNMAWQKAGGMFGLLAAFFAWYICLAGITDDSNSFFTIPVWHFPWSEKGREGG